MMQKVPYKLMRQDEFSSQCLSFKVLYTSNHENTIIDCERCCRDDNKPQAFFVTIFCTTKAGVRFGLQNSCTPGILVSLFSF